MQRFRIETQQDAERIGAGSYERFMAHGSVFAALSAAAQQWAGRTALTYITSADPDVPARQWSYAEYIGEVRRAANLFRQLADGEPVTVAFLLPAIPEAHFTLWGAETAGRACPINYLLNAEHIAELIHASGANILVALGPHPELDIWSRVPSIVAQCPGLRHVLAVGGAPDVADFGRSLSGQRADGLGFAPTTDPDAVVALFHTGGTTGAPKLAQHQHRNQLHSAWGAAQMYAMSERDVIINGFPLFHVAGSFVYGLSTLLSGSEVVLPTLLGMRNTEFVKRYWQFVERHGVTLLAAVPTVIAALLSTGARPRQPNSVRALLTGGSPLPTEIAIAFEQAFGIPVRNILGMTECAGVISIEPFLGPRTDGSCGLPLPFTQVQALGDDGAPRPPGEPGILRVRGPNVGPGYTDRRKNAGTFEGEWLVTGDIGHVDAQGRVFVTGRSKDVIIRSGHNIDPGVIESALLRHPCVQMAAAVGEPDEYAGELPVAFVSLKPGTDVDAAALSAFIEPLIPERPAMPKRIDVLASIPMTAVGKVYKPALRLMATQRAIEKRLEQARLGDEVRLAVVEEPSGLGVRFSLKQGVEREAIAQRLRQVMQPFAVRYEILSA